MKCPNCGLVNPDSALKCDCGYDFNTKTIGGKTPVTDVVFGKQNTNEGGFWSFDKMISGSLIKFLYVLGLLAIIISGIVLIKNGIDSRYGGELLIGGGIGIITLGNLFWRIICEGIIIAFKMFEKLNQIEKKL